MGHHWYCPYKCYTSGSCIGSYSLRYRRTFYYQSIPIISLKLNYQIQCLYLRLKLPEYPETANGGWVLVWSGVTFHFNHFGYVF